MSSRTEIVSVRIPKNTYLFLQKYAQEHNIFISDVIRDALSYYIENVLKEMEMTPELKLRYTLHRIDELQRYAREIRYLHHVYRKAEVWLEDLKEKPSKYYEHGYHDLEIELLKSIEKTIKENVRKIQRDIVLMMSERLKVRE